MFCNPEFCNRIYMKDLKQNYSKCSWKTQNVCCSLEAVLWCRGIHGAFWITGAGLPWAVDLIKGWHCSGVGSCLQQCVSSRGGFAESLNQKSKRGAGGCFEWVSAWVPAVTLGVQINHSVTEGQCQRESWAEGLWKPQLTQLQMDTGCKILMQFIEDDFL